jgi:exonuclease III
MYTALQLHKPDVLCIQESQVSLATMLLPQWIPFIKGLRTLGYNFMAFNSCSNPEYNPGYAGTAVFCRQAPNACEFGLGPYGDGDDSVIDAEGRAIFLEYDTYILVNTYCPSAGLDLRFEICGFLAYCLSNRCFL